MKKILTLVAVLLVCSSNAYSAGAVDNNSTVQHAQSFFEKYKPESNVRLNDNEVQISSAKISGNVQTVKRVEDKDAVCWVVINSKTWDSSISCLSKSELTVTDEPLQKHSITGSN